MELVLKVTFKSCHFYSLDYASTVKHNRKICFNYFKELKSFIVGEDYNIITYIFIVNKNRMCTRTEFHTYTILSLYISNTQFVREVAILIA